MIDQAAMAAPAADQSAAALGAFLWQAPVPVPSPNLMIVAAHRGAWYRLPPLDALAEGLFAIGEGQRGQT